MKALKATLVLLIFIPNISFAQICDCSSNFTWLRKTFEENDAGFSYALKTTGQQAYTGHNQHYEQKAVNIKELGACITLMYDWLSFFRSGHFGIRRLSPTIAPEPTATSDNETWQKLAVDTTAFEEYILNKETTDFEGIWESKPYKIGIKKEGNEYLGFIISSNAPNWLPGHIKLKIDATKETPTSVFYMRDRSPVNADKVELLGENYLNLGATTLKRLNAKKPTDAAVEAYFKTLTANIPFVEKLSKTTMMVRIPTFNGKAKKDIDSVILANKKSILKSENLIIDLRNNGGGNDNSYEELLPFLYTNPIRTVGVEYFSTVLNNQRMLDFINKPEYHFEEEDKKWAQESYAKLSEHLGEFVRLKPNIVSITTFDEVLPKPVNVAILINENCGSTTEQFLLAAKQSKKVKLFGTTTFGVLDISNMYFVNAPSGEFALGYSLSRSMRIPEMTIDKKGIQPDYYIDKSIPNYKWTEFVHEILNQK